MNKYPKNNHLKTLFMTTILSAMAAAPIATMAGGYILDSDGKIIKDQFGGCSRDSDWKEDIASCRQSAEPAMAQVAQNASSVQTQAQPEIKKRAVILGMVPAASKRSPKPFVGRFDSGESDLTLISLSQLDTYARYLKQHATKKLVVRGYVDGVEIAKLGSKLSEQRAQAVKAYLIQKGVAAERIAIVAMGDKSPIADNATPEGRSDNRRVVFELVSAG